MGCFFLVSSFLVGIKEVCMTDPLGLLWISEFWTDRSFGRDRKIMEEWKYGIGSGNYIVTRDDYVLVRKTYHLSFSMTLEGWMCRC